MAPRGGPAIGGAASISSSRHGFGGLVEFGGASPMDTAAAEDVPRIFSMNAHGRMAREGRPSDDFFNSSGFAAASLPSANGDGAGAAATAPAPLLAALPGQDPSWVTVFGFPGRAAALVRQQLEAMCGPIVEVRHGDGNFMHVRFQTVAAARNCLSQHGHTVLGKLIVGCVPCTSGLADGGGRPEAEPDPGPAGRAPEWAAGAAPGTAAPTPQISSGGLLRRLLDIILDI